MAQPHSYTPYAYRLRCIMHHAVYTVRFANTPFTFSQLHVGNLELDIVNADWTVVQSV